MRYFLEILLEISFGSETFCTKFCEISFEILLENSREQRTKFAELRFHYFGTIYTVHYDVSYVQIGTFTEIIFSS